MAAETLPVRIERLVAPVVTAAGLDLEGVEVTPAGRRRVLRVVVDRDGGIDLDGVAEVSRAVSDTLDASDVMGGQAYVLEVTSPGTDRPLTAPRHWRRAVGRLVKAELTDGSTRTARVLEAGEDVAVLADGPLAYGEVRRARVEVEFGKSDELQGEED
ncbi:ribosome maturation factor RimP [Sporichthya polymorpha]|uniref:ribosome maturation factor RimP n=1 Tax=Sporichthya polymorpha TaxID=35751 RepID=UPI000369C884|nr:ribosome maturation factor RimP [Sporichthya polymorpha]